MTRDNTSQHVADAIQASPATARSEQPDAVPHAADADATPFVSSIPARDLHRERDERRRALRAEHLAHGRPDWRPSALDQRIENAIRKGKVLFVKRVSSRGQVNSSTGGNDEQNDQITFLEPYGIQGETDPRVTVIDVKGKSVSWKASRRHMDRIFMELESGAYKIVLVRDADRLTRNAEDSGRLIGLFARQGILLCVGAYAFDVRNKLEGDSVHNQFRQAEYQWKHTNDISLRAKLADAEVADVLLRPCAGVIAADPSDPRYRARLETAGLLDHISPARLQQHKEAFDHRGRLHYYLPFPDADVVRAVEFCLREVRRLGSVARLVDVIRRGAPGYPRPGHVPVLERAVFDHTCQVVWVPVNTRRIRRWLGSGFLYGTYRHSARAVREITDLRSRPPEDVVLYDCFPSYGNSQDEREVQAILTRKGARPRTDRPDGRADAHALDRIVCYHPMSDGMPCKGSLGPLDSRPLVVPYAYQGLRCFTDRGHRCGAFPHVDGVVMEVVTAAFSTDRLAAAVATIRIETSTGTRDSVARLERLIAELKEKNQGARDLQSTAQAERRIRDVEELQETIERNRDRIDELEKERGDVARRARTAGVWAAGDIDRLRALAADLPALMTRARAADQALAQQIRAGVTEKDRGRISLQAGRLRALIGALVAEVRVVPLEDGLMDVTVVFPGGAQVTRSAYVGHFPHAQASGVYAAGRLAQGATAGTVANELNAFLPPSPTRAAEEPWTEGRVLVTEGLYNWPEVLRRMDALGVTGAACTLEQVSAETGETLAAVRRAAFTGGLGLARWDGDRFLVEATRAQRAAALPEYARRTVAEAQGWPVDDTVLVSTLAPADTNYSRLHVAARAGAGMGQDDAGRNYTRASMFFLARTEQLRAAVAREYPELLTSNLDGWLKLSEAKQVSGKTPHHLCTYYPCLRFGNTGDKKAGATFVYFTKEAEHGVAARSLAKAVAALDAQTRDDAIARGATPPAPLRAEDFVALPTLVERWGQVGGPSRPSLERRMRAGALVTVHAFKPAGFGKHVPYIHMPAEVRSSRDPRVLYEWLGIQPPGRYERRSRSRSDNANAAAE